MNIRDIATSWNMVDILPWQEDNSWLDRFYPCQLDV